MEETMNRGLKSGLLALAVSAFVMLGIWLDRSSLFAAFTYQTPVEVTFTWACGLPEYGAISDFTKSVAAAKPVTLRFARYPNVYDIEAQPGLCDALSASGKQFVTGVVIPSENDEGKYVGWNLISVDGHAVEGIYAGTSGSAGTSPPLDELLR